MNIDLMRMIDRRVGVPLCFVFSIWNSLISMFRRTAPSAAPPKRILFIELAETGGLVIARPALDHARRLFPEAEHYFLIFELGDGILELLDFPTENRIVIRPAGMLRFVSDTLRAVLYMRRMKIDAVINLEAFARYSTLLSYLSGARKRVGFHRFTDEGRYIGNLLTHRVIYNPHIHACQSFISLVHALSEKPETEPAAKTPVLEFNTELRSLESKPELRKNVEQELRRQHPEYQPSHRLVLLNPNAGDLITVRRWPEENFLYIAEQLLQQPDVLLAFTGTAKERPYTATIQNKLSGAQGYDRVLNMAGRTTLPELIELYHVSDLMITNDSGPAHFASLTELPVIVFFGPETPDVFGPLGKNVNPMYAGLACSPCISAYNQKRSPCSNNVCLQVITPQQVLEKAHSLMKEK